jgi:hypothetical protein
MYVQNKQKFEFEFKRLFVFSRRGTAIQIESWIMEEQIGKIIRQRQAGRETGDRLEELGDRQSVSNL